MRLGASLLNIIDQVKPTESHRVVFGHVCQSGRNSTGTIGACGGSVEIEGAGVDGEPLELDCEPYVEEGGPSDPDTDAEDNKVMKAPVKAKTSRKKKSAYTSDGPRKSTRIRCVTSRY